MIYSRSDIQTAIISCVLSFLPDSPSVPRTHEWKGSEVMITAYVHHIASVHRQLSVWTYIYTGVYTYENILPLGELVTDRLWLAPKKYGLWDAEKRNGFGENLSCFRSLEEHSLRETIECYRARGSIIDDAISVDEMPRSCHLIDDVIPVDGMR